MTPAFAISLRQLHPGRPASAEPQVVGRIDEEISCLA
jgi:hypothetical protein